MGECMTFPDSVEEFMDFYKIVDTEEIYTNGVEMVPIFRMKQWFAHKQGRWIEGKYSWDDLHYNDTSYKCSVCGKVNGGRTDYCPNCGAFMKGE